MDADAVMRMLNQISVHWILNEEGNPEPTSDLLLFATQMAHDERWIVRKQRFMVGDTEVEVSTVFLGLDHRIRGTEPVLWETMVFGLPEDEDMEIQLRYTSREKAIDGHNEIVRALGGVVLDGGRDERDR